jgi:hypothetical protein
MLINAFALDRKRSSGKREITFLCLPLALVLSPLHSSENVHLDLLVTFIYSIIDPCFAAAILITGLHIAGQWIESTAMAELEKV